MIHLIRIAAASAVFLQSGFSAQGQTPNPAFPVGDISAKPTIVQTGVNSTLTWSVRLPDGEDPANYTHYIRQTLWPSGLTVEVELPSSAGQMLSPLSIQPESSVFQLWTIRSTTLKSMLLDATVGGTYLPIATLAIHSEDPYPYLPRTRADRPFSVDINVQGLNSDPLAPDSSKSGTLLRHAQSYGATGVGDNIDRSQAALLSQSGIMINGAQIMEISSHLIPGDEGSNARGEERFSILTVDGFGLPASLIDSRFIQIWPVAEAVIDGVVEGQTIGPVVPEITVELKDLYPSSTTFAQLYKGSPQSDVIGRIVPDTTFSINSATPQNRTATIRNYLPLFDSDGTWTLEIVTQTPFGTEPITTVSFHVLGTAMIREAWRLLHFGSPANSGAGADLHDFDRDGLPNLLEFAFGLNPKLADRELLPIPEKAGDQLVIDFSQPGGVGGITYAAEWSPDLKPGTWTPLENSAAAPRHAFSLSFEDHHSAFMRLRVVGQ